MSQFKLRLYWPQQVDKWAQPLTNSAIIKQGLFPAPGTKSQLSNTAVKNDYLWMLCEAVFEKHPDYEEVFPKIQSNAEHKRVGPLRWKISLLCQYLCQIPLLKLTQNL